jgi:hypothetical protein
MGRLMLANAPPDGVAGDHTRGGTYGVVNGFVGSDIALSFAGSVEKR